MLCSKRCITTKTEIVSCVACSQGPYIMVHTYMGTALYAGHTNY